MKQDVYIIMHDRGYWDKCVLSVHEAFEEALNALEKRAPYFDGILQIGPGGRKVFHKGELQRMLYERKVKNAELVEIKIAPEMDDDGVIIGRIEGLPILLKESHSDMFSTYECACVLSFRETKVTAYVPHEMVKKYAHAPKLLIGEHIIGAWGDDRVPFADKRFAFV